MLEKMIEEVTKIKLAHEKEDRLIWLYDSKGEFSVKRMPNLLMEKGVEDLSFVFNKIWKMKVPARVRSFLWMLALGRFPTIEFLERRGIQFQQMRKKCPWCDKELERFDHLFFKCKFVKGFWRRIFNW
ncbi:hypothetical protein Gogos_008858 [Gossypium gossypioides]|uniref:Reverse transcriptase zinc-binding domain-containing protein n=1 Tax=Gossypium gossypioides TaxID=34282 RepID=A0A7J9CCZ3_GOSGO|nr:hypothetical protein [Gossypium gossypioides]